METKSASEPGNGVKLPPGRKLTKDSSHDSTKPPSSERKEGGFLKADNKPRQKESEEKMEVGGSEEVEVVGSKESRTVFVSNLVFSVMEDQLKEKFSEVKLSFPVCVFVFLYLLYKYKQLH